MANEIPSKPCFLSLRKPLKSVGASELASIIDKATKKLKPDSKYFPADFAEENMTKTIFASLKEESTSLYKYTLNDSNSELMGIFCSWGKTEYINIPPNKIDSLEIGTECLRKMKNSYDSSALIHVPTSLATVSLSLLLLCQI